MVAMVAMVAMEVMTAHQAMLVMVLDNKLIVDITQDNLMVINMQIVNYIRRILSEVNLKNRILFFSFNLALNSLYKT